MKQLTDNEIKFIKETGWTPTIFQLGYAKTELSRTPYKDLESVDAIREFQKEANKLGVNELALYNKCTKESDGISLEYEASYLFYLFFSKEELENMTDEAATKWLQDFQYYKGYRKWDSGNLIYVYEALDVHYGTRVFYLEEDGEVWNVSLTDQFYTGLDSERILKI